MEMNPLRITDLDFSYPSQRQILNQFSLKIEEGSVTCLLGPSGSGKSTLLHLIAGLLKPDSGTISGVDPDATSIIFQETRVLPWKSVLGNVMFPLLGRMTKPEARRLGGKFIKMMHLENESGFYPAHLSGGMRQRIAIARAFAFPSSLILMDEAFRGLDPLLKKHILENFLEIWKENRRTVVFVTHDIDEALLVGQDIIVLNGPPLSVALRMDVRIGEDEDADVRKRILQALAQ